MLGVAISNFVYFFGDSFSIFDMSNYDYILTVHFGKF